MPPEPVPAPPVEAVVEEPKSPRFDRRLLLAGAGAGGLLLGLLLLMTVFGGKGDVGPVVSRPPVTSTVPAAAVPEPPVGLAPTSDLDGGRDPFLPAVAVPGEPLAGVPSPAGSGQPITQSSGGGESSPGQPVGAGYASLELKSVFRDGAGRPGAEITVDGQSYRPAAGDSFSYGYRLERADGSCVEVSAGAAVATMCLPPARP